MNRIQRCLAAPAALAGALLAFAATPPAALATPAPPDPNPGGYVPVIHTMVTGGMPAWQIALIVVGAALLAAVVAVLADRAWAARRQVTAPAAPGHDHPARQGLHL
jgi:hypothetical protein